MVDRPAAEPHSTLTTPEAFGALYVGAGTRVRAYLEQRVRDPHVAGDLATETFVIAYEQRHRFRGATRLEQEAWLLAIARSRLSVHWRHGRIERAALARVGLVESFAIDAELDRVDELDRSAALRREVALAFAALPEAQRRVIEAHVVSERSYAELAVEWGVTETVLRARVSRGLRALAAVIPGAP